MTTHIGVLLERIPIPGLLVRLYVRESADALREWAEFGIFPSPSRRGFYTLGSLRRWSAQMSAWELR